MNFETQNPNKTNHSSPVSEDVLLVYDAGEHAEIGQ